MHDMNIGGDHVVLTSDRSVPVGLRRLAVRMRRLSREAKPTMATGPATSELTLLIDGQGGRIQTRLGFPNFISRSALDIGRDRGSPVSNYAAPFEFTGEPIRVEVTMDDDQTFDGDGVGVGGRITGRGLVSAFGAV
jgi:arylsulfatase